MIAAPTAPDYLGANWRLQFADADGLPLNMASFSRIDFGAISYKEIFQNVKTILTTPLFSAALERTLGIDQNIVDLPVNRASEATIAILDAIYFWEPRAEVMNIAFDGSDMLNGHLIVNLQLNIKNVIYGTDTPYTANAIPLTPPVVIPVTPEPPMPPSVGTPPTPVAETYRYDINCLRDNAFISPSLASVSTAGLPLKTLFNIVIDPDAETGTPSGIYEEQGWRLVSGPAVAGNPGHVAPSDFDTSVNVKHWEKVS